MRWLGLLLAVACSATTNSASTNDQEPVDEAGVLGTNLDRDAATGTGSRDAPPAPAGADGPVRPGGMDGARDLAAAELPLPSGPCTTQGTELCDDFETGQIDTRLWTIQKNGAAKMSVDAERVHGGKFALHVKAIPGMHNIGGLMETRTFPARNNVFYTRLFAYFSPDLASGPSPAYHQGFIVARGKNTLGDAHVGLGSHGEKKFLGYNFYSVPRTEFGKTTTAPIPPNQWLCLELMLDTTGPLVRRAWIDGAEQKELFNSTADPPAPKFESVFVGLMQYHDTPVLTDMWVDDVRVSSQRIGCAVP